LLVPPLADWSPPAPPLPGVPQPVVDPQLFSVVLWNRASFDAEPQAVTNQPIKAIPTLIDRKI
jgi:hypothetical protein